MRYTIPFDVWLTRAQIAEIAEGTHPTDARLASTIFEGIPDGYEEATFDGDVIKYRGPGLEILEYTAGRVE